MTWLWGVAAGSAGAAAANVVLWVGGERSFVTHPVSVTALGVGAVMVAHLAGRAEPAVRPFVLALAAALTLYLLLGSWASAAPDSLSAGLWSAGWIPVNALPAAIGLTAAGLRRGATAFLALTSAVTAGGALLVRPVAPFQGIATAAPDGWESAAPTVVAGLLVVWNLALLAATAAVFVRARSASALDRPRLARAAAVSSSAPCLVLTCYALAVLRDPGDVDPSTGSVAYTCAIAVLAVVAAWAASSQDRVAVRLLAGIWLLALLVLGGVALAGPVTERNLTVGVLGIVVTTLAGVAGTVWALARFETWSQQPAPRPVDRLVPGLSPRENDVLAAVARGGTNAAVAADLFLSERTVEQHLRSVFDKLDLGDHGGSNRRVRAAALWWRHQGVEEHAAEA